MWDKLERILDNLSWYLFMSIAIVISIVVGISGHWGLMTLFIFSFVLVYFIQIGLIKLFKWMLAKKNIEDIPEDITELIDMVLDKYWRK